MHATYVILLSKKNEKKNLIFLSVSIPSRHHNFHIYFILIRNL